MCEQVNAFEARTYFLYYNKNSRGAQLKLNTLCTHHFMFLLSTYLRRKLQVCVQSNSESTGQFSCLFPEGKSTKAYRYKLCLICLLVGGKEVN